MQHRVFSLKNLFTMPKDSAKNTSAKKNALRPMRTMSKVALAISELEVATNVDPSSSCRAKEGNILGSTPSDLEQEAIPFEFLERETMGPTWFKALSDEFEKLYFLKLKKFLSRERRSHTIYPSMENIYSWSRLTPLDSVKVVILGQDPYHDAGQAHGLSFSVLPPTKVPGSLKNIYKQIKTDYPSFVIPSTGDLTPLAEAGVLWLNASLTVRAHAAASHSGEGWEEFTKQVLRCVERRDRGVVFMAWGVPAQKTIDRIGVNEKRHLVLRSAHPSPLSAYRGFLGNGHFRLANEWLKERHGEEGLINWEVLSARRS
ncbi:uracil-DNA glycosylase-like protein [Mycena sp. CBHHK59/15]|nr:uracil-DNA glycosylase-like protein [Mycena sp. CBHHK59/15]